MWLGRDSNLRRVVSQADRIPGYVFSKMYPITGELESDFSVRGSHFRFENP